MFFSAMFWFKYFYDSKKRVILRLNFRLLGFDIFHLLKISLTLIHTLIILNIFSIRNMSVSSSL